jgi:DNA topoisomerase IA
MMSAKLDLTMKKLEERDIEKKEVTHINDAWLVKNMETLDIQKTTVR